MTRIALRNPHTDRVVTEFTNMPNVETADRTQHRFLNVEDGVGTTLTLDDIARRWGHPDAEFGNLYAFAGQRVVKVTARGVGHSDFDDDGYADVHVVLAYEPTPFEADPHYFVGEFYHRIDGRA